MGQAAQRYQPCHKPQVEACFTGFRQPVYWVGVGEVVASLGQRPLTLADKGGAIKYRKIQKGKKDTTTLEVADASPTALLAVSV